MFCKYCGAKINEESAFCPYCGKPLNGIDPDNIFSKDERHNSNLNTIEVKSRIVAGILALLLGYIGVHKAYCGKIGLFIVYLLFCWTGIPAIIAFIEGILYLCCKDDLEFTEKYCNN